MKPGKINHDIFDRSVKKLLNRPSEKLSIPPAYGCDAGKYENFYTACATACSEQEVIIALNTAVNNLYVSGARPLYITTHILLGEKHREIRLKEIEKTIATFCQNLGLDIAAGDVTITESVVHPVVTVTAIGEKQTDYILPGMKPDMDIVMTGHAGSARAAMLAIASSAELSERCADFLLDAAADFINELSLEKLYRTIFVNSNIAEYGLDKTGNDNLKSDSTDVAGDDNSKADSYDVAAVHDISRGGLYTALWEMAEYAGLGLDVELKKIPIRQETIEICEYYGLNPYEELSTGAALIASRDGESLCRRLETSGIKATVIGRTNASKDRVILTEDERRFL